MSKEITRIILTVVTTVCAAAVIAGASIIARDTAVTSSKLEAHEGLDGHPVIIERVDNRLQSMEKKLDKLQESMDRHIEKHNKK